ncbi:hypothetical protein MON38_03505 [Hymenobacter sp. DH14]|uniref:Uncharacterized protein n=1 Tax=Hymenobacter cyanobacteriorum TaxID=2926463 RepID=A0A9X1VC86_9BACT|nr:hypothetical protein [Hymenobacter cyanobacteriorum]MCI1186469.1 hypothetical protein [Hymenobacter cyanobacteriorum]
MNELANLAQIVTSRRLTALPIIDFDQTADSRESQLVDMLLAGGARTQVQAAKALYGQSTAANIVALKRLKSRVQAKLLNHLYFLDHSNPLSLVSRRYQMTCLDLLHKGTALYTEGDYVLSQRLLRRCLTEAQAGEFTAYAVQSARQLCTIYAQLNKPAAYRQMDLLLQKSLSVQQLEDEAERLYTSTLLTMSGPVKGRRAMLPQMPERLRQLESLHRRANTFSTFFLLYRLRLMHEELLGNFAELIRLTGAAARQYRQGKLNARRFDLRFNTFAGITAYLRGRQAAKGLRLAQEGLRLFASSSGNWFVFQENHVLLALHTKKYDYAQQLLREVAQNPAVAKLRPADMERWDLYRRYADFVAPPAQPAAALLPNKWALMLPEQSRDKSGLNVAILVLQLLHHLRQHNLDEALVRLERLRKYQQRHLHADSSSRSRLFLRLLRGLADTGFDPAKARQRGRATLETLSHTPNPGEAFAEVEIIPYEHLWELALQQLHSAKK